MTVHRVAPGIIYGPVPSRRFGSSLGINLSGPGKYCSFNCIYCFRGFNEGKVADQKNHFPNTGQVMDALHTYINAHGLDSIQNITMAGNGEPTDNRHLPEIIDSLSQLRAKFFPHLKINLLTNGMGFIKAVNPEAETLLGISLKLDRLCLKVDSGNPDTWRKIANPEHQVHFHDWWEAIRKIDRPYIQTMLIQGRVDNTTTEEINWLLEKYTIIIPQCIYFLTLNKPPADGRLIPVPVVRIGEIKELTAKKLPNIEIW